MTFKKLILTLIVLASPLMITVSKAAGMGMGAPTPCGGPFPPCPVPLDNGVLLLLAAGAIYGGKKLYDALKKNPA